MNIEEVRLANQRLQAYIKGVNDRVDDRELEVSIYGEQCLDIATELQCDEALLLTWANDELARRDAERAERAKPIDAEWLLSIGFRDCGSWLAMDVGTSKLWWAQLRRAFGMNGRHVDDITARGQLLDLLAALKGGES